MIRNPTRISSFYRPSLFTSIHLLKKGSSSSYPSLRITYPYGKRKPTKDAFVGSLMELKCLAEGTSLDFGGQRRKQAAKIISTLCLADADSLDEELRENLLLELKNVFLKFMEVSRDGRGFTSLVFGMGQLSDEGVVKKIAEQISAIAFQAPHALHMDKEFALLQEAALQAFRQEYPNREHFLKK